MRVQLVDRVSDGAGRVYETGEFYDLPEAQATAWIARGLAVAVTATAVIVAPEAAALKGPEETAVLPRAAKR